MIVDETEDFAARHERTPLARLFYGHRAERIALCAARKDAQQADLVRFLEAPVKP